VKMYGNVWTTKVDYRMQYYDITNSRWQTAANIKIIIGISVKNDLIMMKFATLNQIVIMIKMIRSEFKFLNSRWRTDTILETVFGHNSAANFHEILYEDTKTERKDC